MENKKLSDKYGAHYLQEFIRNYIPEDWKESVGSVISVYVSDREWCLIKYMAEFPKKFLKYPVIIEAIEKFFEINQEVD